MIRTYFYLCVPFLLLLFGCSYNIKFMGAHPNGNKRNIQKIILVDSNSYKLDGQIDEGKFEYEWPLPKSYRIKQEKLFFDSLKYFGVNVVYFDSVFSRERDGAYLKMYGRIFYDSLLDVKIANRDSNEVIISRLDSHLGSLSEVKIYNGDRLLCDLKNNHYLSVKYKRGLSSNLNINKKQKINTKDEHERIYLDVSKNTSGGLSGSGIFISIGGITYREMDYLHYLYYAKERGLKECSVE